MTFEKWLLTQRKRNDPIGDLANDFYYAKRMRPGQRHKCNREHLDSWNACDEAYDALEHAFFEWKDFCSTVIGNRGS